VALRDLVQLAMYKRNHAMEGIVIAMTPFEEQIGDRRRGIGNTGILA
jgi:hypothetical protein